MAQDLDALRAFLAARVYRHPRVVRVMEGAESIVTDLFARYRDDLQALPPEWREQAPAEGYARYVCDFIAGMTDRYALAEHRRLFDATPKLR
jgi:dGTPase